MRVILSACAVLLIFSVLLFSVGFVRVSVGEWETVSTALLYEDGEPYALLLTVPSEVKGTLRTVAEAIADTCRVLPDALFDGACAVLSELYEVGRLLGEALSARETDAIQI